jgi:hypothetical protein
MTCGKSNSGSEINVKILSCCEQCVCSDEENASDSSSMQHGIWLSDHIFHSLGSLS